MPPQHLCDWRTPPLPSSSSGSDTRTHAVPHATTAGGAELLALDAHRRPCDRYDFVNGGAIHLPSVASSFGQ